MKFLTSRAPKAPAQPRAKVDGVEPISVKMLVGIEDSCAWFRHQGLGSVGGQSIAAMNTREPWWSMPSVEKSNANPQKKPSRDELRRMTMDLVVRAQWLDAPNGYESADGETVYMNGPHFLMKTQSGECFAVEESVFVDNFLRCFADGTVICRLNDPLQTQGIALGNSNAQMRMRIQELGRKSVLRSVMTMHKSRRQEAQVDSWNEQIRLHIDDMRRRAKLAMAS